jgi:hypothetical protein
MSESSDIGISPNERPLALSRHGVTISLSEYINCGAI